MDLKRCIGRSREAVGMILVQLFVTGMLLLSRIILNQGTFIFALMTYRHVVAALCVAPLAFFFERGMGQRLSWLAGLWLFFNALIGITMAMGLYYYGIRDTSATYASYFLNLVPVVTFVFSTITRIEKLRIRTLGGKIKIAGTIVCVLGALTIGLYKGKSFHVIPTSSHHNLTHQIVKQTKVNLPRGTLMLLGSCLSYATWYITQVKLYQVFPSRYWTTMLTCILACLQSAVIGLCMDRSKAAWKLGWNLQLITIFYSGALATAATFVLISWIVPRRGPTYPTMFNPLSLVFVAFLEAFFFGEEMSVGRLLGMVMIILGLYAFLWGKYRETPSLSLPSKSGKDIEMVPENVGLQLTAVVAPTPTICSDDCTPTPTVGEEAVHKNGTTTVISEEADFKNNLAQGDPSRSPVSGCL